MNLLCGLSITEGHGSQIFEDRHLHRAVATIEQRHQGARVHRSIHNLGTNTCREEKRGGEESRAEELIIHVCYEPSELQKETNTGKKNTQQQKQCLRVLGLNQ